MDGENKRGRKKTKQKDPRFVTISEAVSITGICAATLRKFADEKALRSYKTPTGHRMFDKEHLQEMCSTALPCPPSNDTPMGDKTNYLYARVSSKAQLDDLTRQVEYLKGHVDAEQIDNFRIVQDIGSGINFKRKGLQTILESCLQKSIGRVIVAHRDRLSRFAFDLIEYLVVKAGGEIIVCDHADTNTSDEVELAEDLISIVHVFSCRQMGKRRYKSHSNEVHKNQNLPYAGPSQIAHELDAHLPICIQ